MFKTRLSTFLLSAFMVLSLAAHAQQLHFIYIQADNKQPFSVKLNGKYYSSSSIGYLILPKLTDGTYTLEVNFAKNSYPEQTFTVSIAGKDYGYALKNFDDKGWGLFNYQTTSVIMNSNTALPQNNQSTSVTNNSAFGNMLADVVNDKSINNLSPADTVTTTAKATTKSNNTANNKTPVAVPIPSATVPDAGISAALDTATNTAITQNDDTTTSDTDSLAAMTEEDSTTGEPPAFSTTGVIKAEENTGDKGTDLTFIDFNGDRNDTIKAFIPSVEEKDFQAKKEEDTIDINAKAAIADSAKGNVNNPFFGQNKDSANTMDNAATATAKPNMVEDSSSGTSSTPSNKALTNSTCNNMVSDGDLEKLKKRIISFTYQDEVLQAVRKGLKNKCINTAQVKELGGLFLSDDSRYGFYDAVYPYVYDYTNYASLESTLIAPYYKTRFKALLH